MNRITAEKIMPSAEETLRYLGHHGQELTDRLRQELDDCRKQVFEAAVPRCVWGRFPLERAADGIEVCSTALTLTGNDIAALLQDCGECILLAVTLGAQVERLIGYTQPISMTKVLMMDASATAMIEAVCDDLEEKLRAELEAQGSSLTWRYSCGYGDLPLKLQKDFLAALDTQRRIGLTCSAQSIMIPRKSVTAVMGIGGGAPQKTPSCAECLCRESCQLRKAGKSCGYKKGSERADTDS